MHDIKIPDPHGKKADFEVTQVSVAEGKAHEPGEKVKVRFENFVRLVATHDFEEVMKNRADEEVIVSSNLLTDLANAHEEVDEKSDSRKLAMLLIIGVIIGVVITYLVIRF